MNKKIRCVNVPDEVLMKVEKPGRYTGNEINMVVKDETSADVNFGFCFPDVYEVGMSHLGLQILYFFLNRREDTYCQRFFAPWQDMEAEMRSRGIPLFSVEKRSNARDFDFLGFTLQYEMSYSNVINMLNLAGIPIYSADRTEDDPIIVCGGSCAYNPEPLADMVDFFYLGEGETLYDEIIEVYKSIRKNGGSRLDFLEALLAFDSIYIPRFYDVSYHETGEIKSITPNHPKARAVITKTIVTDMDSVFYPEKQLVPLIEVVHERVTLELFRGCIRGCRFCQAGFVYRPVRQKKASTLIGQARELVASSGHEEISLISLSTSDYEEFPELAEGLLDCFSGSYVNLSLPSLRIDAFSLELMEKIQEVRKSSLTFAPEAGSQRMRDVINKNLSEEDILRGCELAFSGGWNKVKLYFMIGLPTETDEDLLGISALGEKIVEKYFEIPKENRPRPVSVNASASCFVPKPFTPFQWDRQDTPEEFHRKASMVKRSVTRKQLRFTYHETTLSSMEGVLARGDRRTGRAIVRAWELGARFDGWTDLFNYSIWKQAFEDTGLSTEFYANRQRSFDEVLPWDHISVGVSKEFFKSERIKAANAQTTPNCREKCSACGARSFGCGICP